MQVKFLWPFVVRIMPKLAIYVPKKAMKEIERWRKRINFSQVFMRALHNEINDRSRILDSDSDQLSAAALHYKRKLSDGSKPLVDYGHQLGSQHVIQCQLSPETIRRILEITDFETVTTEDISAIDQTVGADLKSVDKMRKEQGIDAESHPTWKNEVYRGYVKGVSDAWKQVCEAMKTI